MCLIIGLLNIDIGPLKQLNALSKSCFCDNDVYKYTVSGGQSIPDSPLPD